MILTDRELFLLIICTVFYITLFILVLQSNRRKLQLLQSRLDNIHAMQKMAVMEHRQQDDSSIYASEAYRRAKQCLTEGRSLTEGDRGRAQTVAVAMQQRGSRTTLWHLDAERNGLESPAIVGDSPVRERRWGLVSS